MQTRQRARGIFDSCNAFLVDGMIAGLLTPFMIALVMERPVFIMTPVSMRPIAVVAEGHFGNFSALADESMTNAKDLCTSNGDQNQDFDGAER